jgi:transposase, IS5 family
MHQTKKGNQWYFGMKAHIGVDVASGVVHSLAGTAANEADINQMAAVLHGAEEVVFAMPATPARRSGRNTRSATYRGSSRPSAAG